MSMLAFPLLGTWKPGQIAVAWTESSRPIIAAVEQHVERAWQAAQSRLGERLFDGPMCRLESLEHRGDKLLLTLSRTSYKPFLGTNLTNSHFADTHGLAALANPVGMSAALVSSDGFLLMGRRGDGVAYYPNRVHPFAGNLEPRQKLDVFDDVRRELREELAFADRDIADIACIGMAKDESIRQPELIFAVRSTRPATQIESQLDAAEHRGVWKTPISHEAIEATLRSGEVFTPVAVGAMLLWGRTRFGDEWFAANRP